MSNTDGQLSRAIQCNWKGCRNKTRDASLYCIHHRRARTLKSVDQYKAHDTSLMANSAHSVMSVITNPAHPDNQMFKNIYRSNQILMSAYPDIRLYNDDDARIIGAFNKISDKVTFAGETYTLKEGQFFVARGVSARRHGNDLHFTPDGDANMINAKSEIFATRKDAWVNNYCVPGAIDQVAGEEYDDVAEAFAQINLLGRENPNIDITYIGRGDNGIAIRLHDHEDDSEEVWTYEIGGTENIQADPSQLSTGGYILVRDGCKIDNSKSHVKITLHGGDTVTREITAEDIEKRSYYLNRLRHAMSTVSKYGFIQDGKLRLPVGWNSKDILGL